MQRLSKVEARNLEEKVNLFEFWISRLSKVEAKIFEEKVNLSSFLALVHVEARNLEEKVIYNFFRDFSKN